METLVRTLSPFLSVVFLLTFVICTAKATTTTTGRQEQSGEPHTDLPLLHRQEVNVATAGGWHIPEKRAGVAEVEEDLRARILIMHPIYAGSHELILRHFGERMVLRGHKVTQIRWRSTKTKEVESPVEVITLSPDNHDLRYPYMQADGTFQPPTEMLWERPRNLLQLPTDVFWVIEAQCQRLLGDTALLQSLRQQNFTVAVVDLISNECSLAVAHHLGLPAVAFWGFNFQGAEARNMGIFQSPAVVPNFMSEAGPRMGFLDRVWNSCMALAEQAIVRFHFLVVDANIGKLLPSCPDSIELLRDVQLVLVNTHWALDFAKLMPPLVRYIGCIQCGPPAPLPDHLADWIDGASEGVIFFSLGFTGYESTTVPKAIVRAFMAAFRRLPSGYRVFFRFSPEEVEDPPENVLINDWFPQQDLLGHPATRLFISHCGMNGVNEAMYHGVPIVALPVFADQGDNAVRLREKGVAVILDKYDTTEDRIYDAITAVLGNQTYTDNARQLSAFMHDDPPGFLEAARWIERVHKHRHISYLKLYDGDFNMIQYLALDVAAFLLAIAVLPYVLLYLYCNRTSWWRKKVKTH